MGVNKVATKGQPFQVDTSPTKQVVVQSLTKDATVEACIFDLIDNAIDSARGSMQQSKQAPEDELPTSYAGFEIKLSLTGETFKIEDNCGGIGTSDLQSMVLRFGRQSLHEMGIGAFGVGLNRALFKLGRVSHLRTDNGEERSELVLDTRTYIKDDTTWKLPAQRFPTRNKVGTAIEIAGIPEEIAQQFADKDWVDTLRMEIGQRYARFLTKGLVIAVNDKAAKAKEVPLRENGPYEGEYKFYKTSDGVAIHVQFGQHREHRFGQEKDSDPRRNAILTPEYGWTVFCNDRAIITADTGDKTGWETKFHSEFYGFVGKVSFVCANPSKLPWNTMKTDVDLNNHAYRVALTDMRNYAQKWRSIANARKKGPVPAPIPPKPAPATAPQPTKPAASTPAATRKPAVVIKPAAVTKPDHHQFRTVLPQDISEQHCEDKHLAVVHSAKKIDLGETPYIGMVMIRVLFEISVSTFLHRHGKFDALKQHAIDTRKAKGLKIAAADEKNVWPKMDEILPYLDSHSEIWGTKGPQLKHPLKRMIAHGPILNSAVHNPFQVIDRSKAFEIRNEVLPLLRHLIET